MILLKIIAAWLMADFIAGIFHWFEDKVLLETTNIAWLETIRTDNGDHHRKPGAMLQFSIWENMKSSALVTWPLMVACLLVGWYWLAMVLCFGAWANVVHRFAHMPRRRVPAWIRMLQRTGFFISDSAHHGHHFHRKRVIPKEQTTGKYCVMSSWLNPVLDGIGFWRLLNRLFVNE